MGAINQAFLKQVAEDERVMARAVEAMADEAQLTAAVYRLSGTLEFPRLLAHLVLARRQRNTQEANTLCAEIMWRVEEEVLQQIRKEVSL